MEILIVICLVIVIALLLHDKISINKKTVQQPPTVKTNPRLPDIMGQPKPRRSPLLTNNTIHIQFAKEEQGSNNEDEEPADQDIDIPITQYEPVEPLKPEPNLEEEEEEWEMYGEPNGKSGFASGVSFEELSTVSTLLQQETLDPHLEDQAGDIVTKIQGTELFSLLENAIENASEKIARLLDRNMNPESPSDSSATGNGTADKFDIGDFV